MVSEDLETPDASDGQRTPVDYRIRQSYLEETQPSRGDSMRYLSPTWIHRDRGIPDSPGTAGKVKQKTSTRIRKITFYGNSQKVIREELGEDLLSDADEYKTAASLKADKEVKRKLQKEIDRLKGLPGGGQESNVIRNRLYRNTSGASME